MEEDNKDILEEVEGLDNDLVAAFRLLGEDYGFGEYIQGTKYEE